MTIHLPHITADNLGEHLRKAAMNLHVAATRVLGVATLVRDAANDPPAADAAAVDLARERLLAYHAEGARSLDIAATLIADAWDILDVALGTYNQLACTMIERTALLPPRTHANDTGMQRYEGVVIIRLAAIVNELLDSLQDRLDVPFLPDPFEIRYLPWPHVREQFMQVARANEQFADALHDTEYAIRVLTHAP